MQAIPVTKGMMARIFMLSLRSKNSQIIQNELAQIQQIIAKLGMN